jgi:predicted Zn-dependent protease
MSLGRAREAADSANRAVSLDPADPAALKILARISLDDHRPEAAEKSCRQILGQNAADPEAILMLDEAARQIREKQQAVENLLGPGAAKVSPPRIVPAPSFRRAARAAVSETCATGASR